MQPESTSLWPHFCVVWMILSLDLSLYIKCFLFEFPFSNEWIYFPRGRLGLAVLRRERGMKGYRSDAFYVARPPENWFMCIILGKAEEQ